MVIKKKAFFKDAACSSCDLAGMPFNFAFWLGYFNSCINPFIYACTSRELRRAFHGTICGRHRSLRRQPTSLFYRPRAPSLTSNISVNVVHQAS
uniref:Uncharacterized protein n=1 Tax=Timema tahoe TaxID=61484 RepID=A0A7R9IT18_9NEOP|nr:unnamed protein product [Timema tahoe]